MNVKTCIIRSTLIIMLIFFHTPARSAERDANESFKQIVTNLKSDKCGMIKSSFFDDSAGGIIHIQDYHCQYELQQSMASLLDDLFSATDSSHTEIYMEGAHGPVDTTLFAAIPDDAIRRHVADYLLKNGKISGTEYYAITSNPYASIIGCDDPGLYNQSFALYGAVRTGYAKLTPALSFIDDLCERMIEKAFSGDSAFIFSAGPAAYYRTCDYLGFVTATRRYWQHLPDSMIPHQLEDIARIAQQKESLTNDDVHNSLQSFVSKLHATLTGDDAAELKKVYLNYQIGSIGDAEYTSQLLSFAAHTPAATGSDYAIVKRYSDVCQSLATIDISAMRAVCDALYEMLKSRYFSESELICAYAIECWYRLGDILTLRASRDDFRAFEQYSTSAMFAAFADFARESSSINPSMITLNYIQDLQNVTDQACRFYRYSFDRDSQLFHNTAAAFKSSSGARAVLVSGGFHTPGIVEHCEKNQINYAVIQPVCSGMTQVNRYDSVMLNQPTPLETLASLDTPNRIAPRVALANLLGDDTSVKQLTSEVILLAKIINLAQSWDMFAQIQKKRQEQPVNFRLEAVAVTDDFVDRWIHRYKDIKQERNEPVSDEDLQQVRYLLRDMVVIRKAMLHRDHSRIGVQLISASSEQVNMLVSLAEQGRMSQYIAGNPDESDTFSLQEQIGPFTFLFQRDELPGQTGEFDIENHNGFTEGTDTPDGMLAAIDALRTQSLENPFDTFLKYKLYRMLHKLSDFLDYAARQERIAGNEPQALLIEANSKLYAGNHRQAVLLFNRYLKTLPREERNLAQQYFLENTFMRGEKLDLFVVDEQDKPYVDKYGSPVRVSLFDQNMTFGSDARFELKHRLNDMAARLRRADRIHQVHIIERAARLIGPVRQRDGFYISNLPQNGRYAYHASLFGNTKDSYGAISDGKFDQKEIKQMDPRVTYLYDRSATERLESENNIRQTPKKGVYKSFAPLPSDSITALVANRNHLFQVLARLAAYPHRTVPILDTHGNLMWSNADLAALSTRYGDKYAHYQQHKEQQQERTKYVRIVKNPTKLIAFSDYHNDFNAIYSILRATGFIDENNTIISEPGTAVVINGDIIDRGTGESQKQILDAVMELEEKARQKGVHFIVTMGNHERNFLAGKWLSMSGWYGKKMSAHNKDFFKTIGFPVSLMKRLGTALAENDLYEIEVLRNRFPEAFKYIDYMWRMPIVAQVGGHVFVHAGPLEYVNKLIEQTLESHPDWPVETALDYIFQKEITAEGFASGFFEDKAFTILSARHPDLPEFVFDPVVADRFLSFFDGATMLGLGHRKSLIAFEERIPYDQIYRIGPKRNIVKLDHGVNWETNYGPKQKPVEAKAYVVDPREQDFVYSITESGDVTSLYQEGDSRFYLLRTEEAFLQDVIQDSTNIVDEFNAEERALNEFMQIFVGTYAKKESTKNRKFTQTVQDFLAGDPRRSMRGHEKYNGVQPDIQFVATAFDAYIDSIRSKFIEEDDVSLDTFQRFIEKFREGKSIYSATYSAGRRKPTHGDVFRFYSALDHSVVDNLSHTIIMYLRRRMDEKMRHMKPTGRYFKQLTAAREQFDSLWNSFSIKTLQNLDGNPGIFSYRDGFLTMTFPYDGKIYLSKQLVDDLWTAYRESQDVAYLDQLLGLIVYELHRYKITDSMPISDELSIYRQAQALEKHIAGKGSDGSVLDDHIRVMISNWREETHDERMTAIEKFLSGLQKYIRSNQDINMYRRLFSTMGIALEANLMTDFNVADAMYTSLIAQYPGDVFNATFMVMRDPISLLLRIDTVHFQEHEMIFLTDAMFRARNYMPRSIPLKQFIKTVIDQIENDSLKPPFSTGRQLLDSAA